MGSRSNHINRLERDPAMPAKKTIQQFIDQSTAVHGHKYDYSAMAYVNVNTPIEISCPDHGPFKVWPKRHYAHAQGCPVCGIGALNLQAHVLKIRKTHEQFLIDAMAAHGDLYDYSQCEYVCGKTKMPIICKQHGIFYQTSENHVNLKQGCPKCYNASRLGRSGLSGYCSTFFDTYPEKRTIPAILYVARMQHKNDDFLKIGITTKDSVKDRFYYKSKNGTVITPVVEKSTTLYDAFLGESKLLSALRIYRYYPNRKFAGYTECVKLNHEVISFLGDYFTINTQDILYNF